VFQDAILARRLTVIGHLVADSKVQAETRTGVLQTHRHAVAVDQLLKTRVEVLADRLQSLVETGRLYSSSAASAPSTVVRWARYVPLISLRPNGRKCCRIARLRPPR